MRDVVAASRIVSPSLESLNQGGSSRFLKWEAGEKIGFVHNGTFKTLVISLPRDACRRMSTMTFASEELKSLEFEQYGFKAINELIPPLTRNGFQS